MLRNKVEVERDKAMLAPHIVYIVCSMKNVAIRVQLKILEAGNLQGIKTNVHSHFLKICFSLQAHVVDINLGKDRLHSFIAVSKSKSNCLNLNLPS